MIRSTKHTLKYTNSGKRDLILLILAEYRTLVHLIINKIWDEGYEKFNPLTKQLELQKLLPSAFANQFDTWLSARLRQCAGKQALGMIRAATEKQRKRFFVLKKLQKKKKDHANLQRYIDTHPLVKPTTKHINMELDSRFVDFSEQDSEFDLFIRLSSIGNKYQVRIPVKHHEVSRKWLAKGTLKKSIRVSERSLTLIYDVPDKKRKKKGRVVGCDQGYLTAASFSDQQTTPETCPHGHTLKSVCTKLARKRSGSRGSSRAREHRKNFINWSLNQIDFSDVNEVRLEEVINLRKGKKQFNKSLMHWTYTQIRRKLEARAETEGFCLSSVPSVYRSQRCSKCGWVLKANRKGKTFRCRSCSNEQDADLNAASNLELDLPKIPFWVRQQKTNLAGFFWNQDGLFSADHESIVRGTKRTKGDIS